MIIRKCDNCGDECQPLVERSEAEVVLHPNNLRLGVVLVIKSGDPSRQAPDLCPDCQRDAIRLAIGERPMGKVRQAKPDPTPGAAP